MAVRHRYSGPSVPVVITDGDGVPSNVTDGAIDMYDTKPYAEEQYTLAAIDLGSTGAVPANTAIPAALPTPSFAPIGHWGRGVALLTVTGDGTASVGFDVSADAATWYRCLTPIATGLTKITGIVGGATAGAGTKHAVLLPDNIWGRYIRLWAAETGTSATVTVAALIGGRM
jgi:hypothetical protein